MRKAVLDTDTLSEVFRGKDPNIVQRADDYVEVFEVLTFTAVSVHEIVYGLTRKAASRQLTEANKSFEENEILLPTLEDYERSGEIRGLAARQGRVLETNDCLIGAVAERLGIPVATGNVRHFGAMVAAGLRVDVEDWRRPILSP